MALDIKATKGRVWVNYLKDERYLLSFASSEAVRLQASRMGKRISDEDDIEAPTDFMIAVLEEHVHDWEGLSDGDKELECNADNRQLVFKNFGSRTLFLFKSCQDPSTFMDGEADTKKS